MDNNFMPKNIFKGTNSDGTTFRVEEWDFITLSNMELPRIIVMAIFFLVFSAFASPILTLLFIFGSVFRAKIFYFISGLVAAFMIYDFTYGIFILEALSMFFDNAGITYILFANILSLVIAVIMFFFGGMIQDWMYKPISSIKDEDVIYLSEETKKELLNKVERNHLYYYTGLLFLFMITILTCAYSNKVNKTWVNDNLTHSHVISEDIKKKALDEKIKTDTENYYKNHPKEN